MTGYDNLSAIGAGSGEQEDGQPRERMAPIRRLMVVSRTLRDVGTGTRMELRES